MKEKIVPQIAPAIKRLFTNGLSKAVLTVTFCCGLVSGFAQSPGGVSGASLWLKADAGTSTTTNNAALSQWSDQSGNANHATMASASLQPTYRNNTTDNMNFNPGVYLTGGQYLNLTASKLPQGQSASSLVFAGVTATTSVRSTILSWGNGNYAGDASELEIYYTGARFDANTTGVGTSPGLWSVGVPCSAIGTYAGNAGNINIYTAGKRTDGPQALGVNVSAGGSAYIGRWLASVAQQNYTGNMGDVIVYPFELSTTQRQRVESYLAVKYGYTIDQTAPQNYLSSASTTIWDAITNSTYKNNIAGIGRDDASALYQRQSKSVNSGVQPVIGLGTIASTNAANTNTFSADQSFEIWGDDGGSTSFATAISLTGLNTRMTRIWKVQETGTVGNVLVAIPASAVSAGLTNVSILVNNGTNFNSGTTTYSTTPLTVNGTLYYTATVDFTDGQYFTFAGLTTAPGGVSGATVWVKADAGISYSSGNTISNWTNLADATNNYQTGIGSVTHNTTSNLWNFNPTVSFNGTSNLYSQNNVPTVNNQDYTKIAVSMANTTGNIRSVIESSLSGTGNFSLFYQNSANPAILAFEHNSAGPGTTSNYISGNIYNDYIIATQRMAFNVASGTWTNVNGRSGSKFQYGAAYNAQRSVLGTLFNNNQGPWPLNGYLPEFIEFGSAKTDPEIRRVESYLAIKYGTTLSNDNNNNGTANEVVSGSIREGDYVASDGTTVMWSSLTNAGYHNNIAGVGRDDLSGLSQKQSQSTNTGVQPAIALGTLATSNAANTNTFSADKNFEVWGSDNGSTSFATVVSLSGLNFRMTRIWRVQETGSVGNVLVAIPASAVSAGITSVSILVNNGTNFNTGTTTYSTTPLTVNGTLYYTATVDFVDGQYFTFAGLTTAPGNVSSNLAFWYRGDAGVTTASGTVSQWTDAYNGYNAVQATSTAQPAYNSSSNLFNYNPTLSFNGSQNLKTASTLPGASNGINTYVVFQPSAAGYLWHWTSAASPSFGFMSYTGNTSSSPFWAYTDAHSFIKTTAGDPTLPMISSVNWNNTSPGTFVLRNNGQSFSPLNSTTALTNMATGSSFVNIGAVPGGVYTGRIAEIIGYNASATAAQRLQIESYLALKYGITLDQTTAQNYLNASGTTVWDATTNSTYSNNIAGIGRDDQTALYQKQSQSANTGIQPVIALGNTLATSNATNTNTFSANQSYEIWGSDTGPTYFHTTFLSGGMNNRMTRVWKVQESGTVGTVFVALPAAAIPAGISNFNLLVSNNAGFSGATIVSMSPQTINSKQYYTATVDFTDGQYFTFGGYVLGPGGVAGASLWMRADAGTSTTSNNTGVSQWNDQSGNGRIGTQGTAANQPIYRNNATDNVNFNPVLKLNGGQNIAVNPGVMGTGTYTGAAAFVVATADVNVPAGCAIFNEAPAANQLAMAIPNNTSNNVIWDGGYNSRNYFAWDNSIHFLSTPYLYTGNNNTSLNPKSNLRMNGKLMAFHNVVNSYTGNSFPMYIGSNQSSSYYHNGRLGEVVVFTDGLSLVNQQKIESYLGIKYGLTLDQTTAQNYLNSAGSTIWDGTIGASYKNNIAGIGRDDASVLTQKQSQSVNSNTNGQVSIGLGSIAATNSANTGSFPTDKTFMIWGDNGNTQSLSTASTSFTYNGFSTNVRMNRVWQVQNTGVSQAVQIQFPTASVGTSATPTGTCAQYVIIYSTDPTFATGVTAATITTSGSNYIASRKFPQGTSYFTFARVMQVAPGIVTLPTSSTTISNASPCTTAPGFKYYYYDAGQTQKAFAINWNGNTEPGGLNGVLTYSASPYTNTNSSYQCNIMGRLLEVLPAGGSYTTNGGVQVKIFFDSAELNSSLVPGLLSQRWFKYSGNAAAAIAANNGSTISGAAFLTPAASGEEDGVDYVQFNGIQSFSTFGFASNTGAFPLPVKLESFGATASACNALLNWTTLEETNTDKFIVEQSTDGTHFTAVASVAAKNIFDGGSYRISVSQNVARAYYRLQILNNNGTSTYSSTVVANVNCTGNNSISLLPNPLNGADQLKVQFSTPYRGAMHMVVVNALGQKIMVKQQAITATNNLIVINTAGWATGTYIVRITGDNGEALYDAQKFVK